MKLRKVTLEKAIVRYRGKFIVGPDGHGVVYGGYCERVAKEDNGTLWLVIRCREVVDGVGILVYLRQSLCTVR